MIPRPEASLLDVARIRIDPAWAMRVPPNLAIRRQVLPFCCQQDKLFVACADAGDTAAFEAIERFTGKEVVPQLAEPDSLRDAIQRVYAGAPRGASGQGTGRGASIDVARHSVDVDPDDVVGIGDELLHAAILFQASDIHIDPGRDMLRVRLRIDGVLENYRALPMSCHAGLISRFKVLAGMDIAEKRAPQDGAFTHRYGAGVHAKMVDVRAATLPTKFGERLSLRLLALETESLTLENLGMLPRDLRCVHHTLARPHGLILLTGPTGSGKTTTLYGMIRHLAAQASLNILTIENPIEYEIPEAAQVQVEADDKVSFGRALRSALRHDPDVLMIGEIRDAQTLDVAIKSSLTGHLVLSTLHTNSAAGAVTRLRDMGAERFLIAATLRLALAQRLVRRLCQQPGCRRPRELTVAEATALGNPSLAGSTVHDPGGCIYCGSRGHVGRVGLFEAMPVGPELADRISAGAPEAEIVAAMRQMGCADLREDAAAKVEAGLISVREAIEAIEVF